MWECKLVQPLWKTVWRFLKTRALKGKNVYMYMCFLDEKILFSHKKKAILLSVTTWMDLECMLLNETSQR